MLEQNYLVFSGIFSQNLHLIFGENLTKKILFSKFTKILLSYFFLTLGGGNFKSGFRGSADVHKVAFN